MTDGVLIARDTGVIVLADAIPISDREMREMDQLLDTLGVPRRHERNDRPQQEEEA